HAELLLHRTRLVKIIERVDAEHHRVFVELADCLHQDGDLAKARLAPASPEVDHDGLAAKVAQGHRLAAVERFELKVLDLLGFPQDDGVADAAIGLLAGRLGGEHRPEDQADDGQEHQAGDGRDDPRANDTALGELVARGSVLGRRDALVLEAGFLRHGVIDHGCATPLLGRATRARSRWWGKRDSNPHTLRYVLLRHARLPIPPSPRRATTDSEYTNAAAAPPITQAPARRPTSPSTAAGDRLRWCGMVSA